MHIKPRQAFTLVELIFVILIIGILSAIAVPKFQGVSEDAYIAKAQSTLANVMSAIATERQKRILKGTFDNIEDLGDETYAFYKFHNGDHNEILSIPKKNCASGAATACWERFDATHYKYHFPNSDDGTADFKLENNKLVCDSDESDCAKLIR